MRFVIPGRPQAQGRPRFFRMGQHVRVTDPRESAEFKNKVGLYYREAGGMRFEGPVEMHVTFLFERPKRLMRRKDPDGPVPKESKPDLDNLLKAIKDGLNGLAYRDDSQVCRAIIEKYHHGKTGRPQTEVEILPYAG